jgi:hypothetical protein
MRYLYILLFLVIAIGFYSCTDTEQKQENNKVALVAANWNDTTTMGKVINDYYKDSVFKVRKTVMEIRDPFMNSRMPYQYLQLIKVLRPQFKQTSKTMGFMPVFMTGFLDSAIVDFQITWTQPNPNDSAGVFVVTDKLVQRVGNQPRYEWTQEGEYWIRKNVEVPEEIKTSKELRTLNLEKVTQIQEEEIPKKGK